MRKWLRLPSREELEANRFLRPWAAHLSSPLIWRFNRRGVARGTALGMFAGFAIPVAQTPFAALFAVGARANLPVAALTTFVTNPFTVPFFYLAAYFVGRAVLQLKDDTIFRLTADAGPIERAINWIVTLAGPTYVGLLIFASVGAVAGYAAVHIGWRIWVAGRWNRRRRRRAATPPTPTGVEA